MYKYNRYIRNQQYCMFLFFFYSLFLPLKIGSNVFCARIYIYIWKSIIYNMTLPISSEDKFSHFRATLIGCHRPSSFPFHEEFQKGYCALHRVRGKTSLCFSWEPQRQATPPFRILQPSLISWLSLSQCWEEPFASIDVFCFFYMLSVKVVMLIYGCQGLWKWTKVVLLFLSPLVTQVTQLWPITIYNMNIINNKWAMASNSYHDRSA